LGQFAERRGDPQAGVGAEVVVAPAQILHEGVSGDSRSAAGRLS
jgi:hypothetical protein